MWWSKAAQARPSTDEITRMAFGARHKKLWPDAMARVKKAVGDFDYSPAAVERMIDAIEQEIAWDWD